MKKHSSLQGYTFLLALISILLSSCNSNKSETTNNLVTSETDPIKITADVLDVVNSPLDDLIKISKIIPLETPNGAPVGEYIQMAVSETGILICNPYEQQLIVFETDGKYRCKIQQPGKGPGEYASISGQDWIRCQNSSNLDAKHDIVISDMMGKSLYSIRLMESLSMKPAIQEHCKLLEPCLITWLLVM